MLHRSASRCRSYIPDRAALIRLVGAVLAKQDGEQIEGGYCGLDVLVRCRTDQPADSVTKETRR